MVQPIFRWDALLLTGFEDFSTADGNARDTFSDNAPATQTATCYALFSDRKNGGIGVARFWAI